VHNFAAAMNALVHFLFSDEAKGRNKKLAALAMQANSRQRCNLHDTGEDLQEQNLSKKSSYLPVRHSTILLLRSSPAL
jgi:hypothetical protein